MQPGYPYRFKRSMAYILLQAFLFLLMSVFAVYEFSGDNSIWAIVFSILAAMNLAVGIFLLVKPFAVLTEYELTFCLAPFYDLKVALRDIADMHVHGNRLLLLLASGRQMKVNMSGMEAMDKNNLLGFLQGVVRTNNSSFRGQVPKPE